MRFWLAMQLASVLAKKKAIPSGIAFFIGY